MLNKRVERGRRTQTVVAEWLCAHGWPRAKPVYGTMPGRDILNVHGHAIEVKARADFSPRKWWRQARGYAKPGERPCVILRCNGQGENADDYLVIRRLIDDELNNGERFSVNYIRKAEG